MEIIAKKGNLLQKYQEQVVVVTFPHWPLDKTLQLYRTGRRSWLSWRSMEHGFTPVESTAISEKRSFRNLDIASTWDTIALASVITHVWGSSCIGIELILPCSIRLIDLPQFCSLRQIWWWDIRQYKVRSSTVQSRYALQSSHGSTKYQYRLSSPDLSVSSFFWPARWLGPLFSVPVWICKRYCLVLSYL